MNIEGLAAIVAGGASGLGGATAERLAQAGAKVTIFDLNAELGAAYAKQIGGRFAAVDVTDEVAVEQAISEAEGLHGKARILVNCAGIGPPAKVIGRDGKSIARIGTSPRLPHRKGKRASERELRSESQRPVPFAIGVLATSADADDARILEAWSAGQEAGYDAAPANEAATGRRNDELHDSPVDGSVDIIKSRIFTLSKLCRTLND